VTGADFAIFQDIPGRKVFKIHGSISNYGALVATEEDYKKCYRRLGTGIIGAVLKHLLVSKTIIFVGYSLVDEDFQKIYRLLKKDAGGIMPLSYIVTLDEHAGDKIKNLKMNTTPIITDASYFIEEFKKILVTEKLMLPDSNFDGLYDLLPKVLKEHHTIDTLNLNDHPDSIYSLSYQDGLIHAFTRAINKMSSGEYSCASRLIQIIENYNNIFIKPNIQVQNYWNAAYFIGYRNGLICILDVGGRDTLPLYFLFGQKDIHTYEQYLKAEQQAYKKHKISHEKAKQLIKQKKPNEVTFHHLPF
jgi:hypothetical protein